MPVVRTGVGPQNVDRFRPLWQELAAELADPKPFGQPMVSVETFPRNNLDGVTVIWDKLAPRNDGERSAIITRAYEEATGPAGKDKLAFAVGLTVPEALDSFLLPYELQPVEPAESGSEPAAPDQHPIFNRRTQRRFQRESELSQAMLSVGGSDLHPPSHLPQLCFQTAEQAEACRQELTALTAHLGVSWQLVEHPGGVAARFEDD